MTISNLLRAASLVAVMMAGSCAAPINDDPSISSSPDVAHPISVEPHFQSLKMPFSSASAGLMPDDEARFMDFVQTYIAHGNGSISVSAPDGPGSQAVIHYFGSRLADMGVLPSHILVGTHDASAGDDSVELGFILYEAQSDSCGDWSESVADTASNLPMKNFGCAVQHNIAAMVADPRDLVEPRPMGTSDASRRNDVMTKYEKGAITQADKNKADKVNEQSGADSDVGR